jgi:hypothetical protein
MVARNEECWLLERGQCAQKTAYHPDSFLRWLAFIIDIPRNKHGVGAFRHVDDLLKYVLLIVHQGMRAQQFPADVQVGDV